MSSSRLLEPEESHRVRTGLETRWELKGFQSPRRRRSRRAQIERFDESEFWQSNLIELIQLALGSRGVSRVYELHEYSQWDRELDIGLLEPGYVLWTDDTFDWLVYSGDYDTPVTIAGASLLWDIKEVWPDWRGSRA